MNHSAPRPRAASGTEWPLRVLLLAAAAGTTGGGEKHVADLLDALPERGFELALACPAGGDLGERARALGVPVFEAPIAAGVSAAQVRALRAALGAAPWDVVHAHGSRAAAFARLADAQARRRVVYHVHGVHVDRAGTAARRTALLAVERTLRPRTARFVTVCRADALRGARLGILAASRTVIVHNGIAAGEAAVRKGRFRAELALPGDTPLVLSVGRFHEQKDQATLLEAWQLVAAARPDAVLALIGSGSLEARLREHARAAGLDSSVRFVAPRIPLDDAYTDADVFALSSRWEGLPYVVLEAMEHGLPVVSTAVDGVPEAVVDGETGLLVPPADPVALSAALIRVLADPAAGRAMGRAGRARVEREFTLERMADGVASVYHATARAARAAR